MPEGVPGDMTAAPPPAPSGMEVLELTQKISECATRIGNVTEDLAITLDHFNHGRVELQKGFQELSTQIKSTAHCITTMTSGVSFQAGEITKLLKAFDRWATTGRWALAGSQSVETNIQGVRGEVEKQAKKLEASLSSGFESIGGHLQELVKLLREQPQSAAVPAAVPASVPDGATDTGTPLTPGAIGAPAVGAPVVGVPGTTGRAGSTRSGGLPLPGTGSTSSGGLPLPGSAHCYISSSTSGVASVTLYGILSGAAEWDEAKYSPSDPDAESACGHRYQRCGNGGAEDVVTDTISS